MEETTTKVIVDSAAMDGAGTGDQQDALKRTQDEEEEGEMPLLFMERLPSDFTSNAQLAAIATFMDDSDTEQRRDDSDGDDDEDESDAAATYTRASSKRQVKKRDAKRVRKQAPYAKKTSTSATKSRGGDASSSAKELQVYLSMFKM